MAETCKAHERRTRENFYKLYCQGKGIDIGCGDDPLPGVTDTWDKPQGDAALMNGVPDEKYDYIHTSHCLEHIDDVLMALRNWWRILKPGGFLILFLPHRDLYEKRKKLPSRYNADHRHFWLPELHEPPCTYGLGPIVRQALPDAQIIYNKACSENWSISDPNLHSNGEYSIECVVQKPASVK